MKTGEDFLFYLLLAKTNIFYGINEPLCIISRGHGSIMQNRSKRNRFDEVIAYKILKNDKSRERINYLAYLSGISYHYLYYAKDYFEEKMYDKYFTCLFKSFIYNPVNQYLYKHIIGDVILKGLKWSK